MARTTKKRSGPPKSARKPAITIEELPEELQRAISQRDAMERIIAEIDAMRLIDSRSAALGRDDDQTLLDAMDVISRSIEEHNGRWMSMLEVVESDLATMLPADKAPAPSAA